MPLQKPGVGGDPPRPAEKKPASSGNPQSKAIQWVVCRPKYYFQDLILESDTKNQLLNMISYFQNKDLLFNQWGLRERYANRDGLSANLYGEPGTGKTMAAHAIAASLNLPMICVDYAEIESKYVGETAKNLTALFHAAKENHAVIFFDEADALLSKRVTNMTSATDVSVNQTRSVLLTLLNDYRGVILFASNFIQNFDTAFLRRIQYHVPFHLPNQEIRERLWHMYIPSKMPCSVDVSALAKKYDGVSGSDISSAVFSAAVGAAREHERFVSQERFEKAIQGILDVKKANAAGQPTVKKRILSEEEAREKMKAGEIRL